MANEPLITIVGRLGADPELRFTPSGAAVVNFPLVNTPRSKNQANEWVDGEPTWFTCDAWREMAENIAESLSKGDNVIVTGYLTTETYERRDGSGKGSKLCLKVAEIGPSLRWATAKVNRRQGNGNGSQQARQPAAAGVSDPWAQPQADPWA